MAACSCFPVSLASSKKQNKQFLNKYRAETNRLPHRGTETITTCCVWLTPGFGNLQNQLIKFGEKHKLLKSRRPGMPELLFR